MGSGENYGWDFNGNLDVNFSRNRKPLSYSYVYNHEDNKELIGSTLIDKEGTCKDDSGYLPMRWRYKVPNGYYIVTAIFPEYGKMGCSIQHQKSWCPGTYSYCEQTREVYI